MRNRLSGLDIAVARGGLCRLDLDNEQSAAGPFATVTILIPTDTGGVIRDPVLSYDANRLLFAWRQDARDQYYKIYERDLATGEIHPISAATAENDSVRFPLVLGPYEAKVVVVGPLPAGVAAPEFAAEESQLEVEDVLVPGQRVRHGRFGAGTIIGKRPRL